MDQMLAHCQTLNTTTTRNIRRIRTLDWISTLLWQEQKDINPLVQELRQIGIHSQDHTDSLSIIPMLNCTTMFLDVAAITADRVTGNRVINFHRKNQSRTSTIQVTDILMEPLCYPLLNPHGMGGWGESIRKEVRLLDCLSCRFLKPERNSNGTTLMALNKPQTRLIPTNRFRLQSRLRQTYLVDMV